MAIFGNGDEIEELKTKLAKTTKTAREIDVERKNLAAQLADAQQQLALQRAEMVVQQAEIEKGRAAVRKARQRQRNSVERANRFKARLS